MLSSVGLPGLNGFVGEFLILLGIFKTSKLAAAVGTSGVIFGAVYMLWMFQRVMFGPLDKPANQTLADLTPREILVFVPLLIMMFVMGLYPKPFLSRMEPAVEAFVQRIHNAVAPSDAEPSVAAVSGRTSNPEPEAGSSR
jgi:NADH-quinone oxidoreductase subunit M